MKGLRFFFFFRSSVLFRTFGIPRLAIPISKPISGPQQTVRNACLDQIKYLWVFRQPAQLFMSIYQNLRWILIILTFTNVVRSSKELLFGGYSLFVFTAARQEAKGKSTVDFRPVTACMAFHRQTILISTNSDWLINVGRLF